MPKLSELLAEKAKGDVQVGGAAVSFTFYVMVRERFSDEEWAKLIAVHGRKDSAVALVKSLIDWDLVDDSGTMIPITAEAFDQYNVPDALLFAIERRIFLSDLSGKVPSTISSST